MITRLTAIALACHWWVGLGMTQSLAEQRRVALIVGNSTYTATTALPNPANDVAAFGAFLTEHGFEVEQLVNVDRAAFADGLARFARRLRAQDIALFYYAGHGLQLRGENYLLGVDAKLESEFDVEGEAVSLNAVIELMERQSDIALLFIDACRNNPLADRLALTDGATRSAPLKGLAPIDAAGAGTMVAFAAMPGQIAYDGAEQNSPFTSALIAHLATPQLEIGTAFKRVIRAVREKTGGRQSPQIVSNLSAELYLGVDGGGAGMPAAEASTAEAGDQLALARIARPTKPELPDPASKQPVPGTREDDPQAAAAFAAAERLDSERGWKLFLARYPAGTLSERARARLDSVGTRYSPQQQELMLALSQERREAVQTRLSELGFDPGPPDGDLGARTRHELVKFQSSEGLSGTGYVDAATLERLGLPAVQVTPAGDAVSASGLPPSGRLAKAYAYADLELLETDPRVMASARCLDGDEIIYGHFQAHLYVAVRADGDADWNRADAAATRCGAYLAAIGSKAENDFVYDLFAGDRRYLSSGSTTDGTWVAGPRIGLRQAPGSREPRAGWGWSNGEPLVFTNWGSGLPDEWENSGQNYVSFFGWSNDPNVDASTVRADDWDDTDAGDTLNGFVIEFE
jgi:peptidoglycan hydrolase-like protein with peptidoglycan-binding domain